MANIISEEQELKIKAIRKDIEALQLNKICYGKTEEKEEERE